MMTLSSMTVLFLLYPLWILVGQIMAFKNHYNDILFLDVLFSFMDSGRSDIGFEEFR